MSAVRFTRHVAELLRAGPPHNQLLSPLVPYIALFDDEEPVTVHLNQEHRDWLSHLRALRYAADDTFDDPLSPRARALDHLRNTVSGLLPFPAATRAATANGGFNHLRIVLTPDELAALPFELLGTTPPGAQVDPANTAVITREIRLGGRTPSPWVPTHRPRILFAAAQLPDAEVPYRAHLLALDQALAPWHRPKAGTTEVDRDALLTVLPNASLRQIADACASTSFTHVHVLAHGVPSGPGEGAVPTVRLHGDRGGDQLVNGTTLASALRPARQGGVASSLQVVTLATCDSAARGSVVLPGASLAQEIHAAGVPLVVGSQFPLTHAGSVRLTQSLYTDLLRGEHPLLTLRRTREELYRGAASDHDWASMVAYARLPRDLDDRVAAGRLRHAFPEMEVANTWIDAAMDSATRGATRHESTVTAKEKKIIEQQIERLLEVLRRLEELEGERVDNVAAYGDAWGLAGSGWKRVAHALFMVDRHAESLAALRRSEQSYEGGMKARVADHWNTVQWLLLRTLRGAPTDGRKALIARAFADADTSTEEWGPSSLVELDLLEGAPTAAIVARIEAMRHEKTQELTVRQLKRYVSWWGRVPELQGAPALAERAKAVLEQIAPGR